ncbi:site-2 protease family protein [Oceanobacillus sp. Castelsardo]|uniref:site-2 protease family protein n=1 Tax=Oceanobacillus sp. Castelsardo TaxID=1851204 RepID=UPI00083914AD|nr:site-2 protease family protein [Oceanobacillus sp. Castelsardo]
MNLIQVLFFLVLIIAPLSTFFHEIGHAIAARTLKASEITLKMGIGKRILAITLLELNIEIYSLFFIGGHTVSSRHPYYKKGELIYISLMGPLSNGIIALFLCLYLRNEVNLYIELSFWFNIWLFIMNIIPIRLNNKYTDGYIVYKLITEGQK